MARPRLPEGIKKRFMPLALSPWLIDWMTKHPRSRASLIEEALIKTYDLKEPLPEISNE